MENNDDCISDKMSRKHSPISQTYASGLYGKLVNVSRVGNEYQTEIPSLITISEYLEYIPNEFLIGLDIPVVWINQKNMNDNMDNVLVPGCVLKTWSEMEKRSFVLGLYIFEKNFVLVKWFMESKKIGEILSYYYGEFYRGDEYKRWSDCRKSRGKKCVLGQRIFSGLRQQEFLARLFPRVSHECQNSLMEVSRTFEEGGISLEHYMISLKTLIGIEMLIDAVAIGKSKQDLTGSGIEPTKENQAIHIRPEIPIGKACSSLTAAEIAMFLTGDYRLSKARSNDLFWEAVWPRLLARGWHSEQPSGYNYATNGKHSLVFLMPGVKKFSRKLVKGEGYLDSVTDVLNKVALDPQLIELDCEENEKIDVKIEDEEEEKDKLKFREKRKIHFYLKPRAPNPSKGNVLMKCTVVDTSLSGGKVVRVTDLGLLKLNSRCRSDEIHSELVSSDESDKAKELVDREERVKKQKVFDDRKIPRDSDEGPMRKVVMKDNMSRKSKQEISGHRAKRRRRLTACSQVESSLERDMCSSSHVGSSSQANNNNNKLSSNLSFNSRCSSIDSVEDERNGRSPHGMNLIDLNVTPECGNVDFVKEVKDERNGRGPQKEGGENVVGCKEKENGGGLGRRQGARNRPPTARALEAYANGFLTVNSRKKSKGEEEEYENMLDYGYKLSKSKKYQKRGGEVGIVSDASSIVKGDDENGEIDK
ncbi:uncharacterized protein [Rutidosis leptorrhynchoides]|uniref:uncharacterized protein n=1 Tax=Rutidosis leptorrhynchoides TaxID=125765 RepID=UPI003A994C63